MNPRIGFYRRFGKRPLDLLLSISALVVLSPLLLLIAVCVRCFLGSPVLFRQRRSGLHRQSFTILKFRTMTDARDERGNLRSDTERLTRVGRLLRSTSLDELPELVNVLKGDMSLVGPRPLVPQYDPYYRPEEIARFDVLPGITGWAQVNGRNALSWEQRFACDVWYVSHLSLWTDLKILFLTVGTVLRREHVHVDTSVVLVSLDDARRTPKSTPATEEGPRLELRPPCVPPLLRRSFARD